MNGIDPNRVSGVVADMLAGLNNSAGIAAPARSDSVAPVAGANSRVKAPPVQRDRVGVFCDVDVAVLAARDAQLELSKLSLGGRKAAIDCIRRICIEQAEELGRMEFAETRIGRLEHKIEKLPLVATVPGVEMMRTEAVSGGHGLTVTEFAPFGVVGVITPVTHSIPTLASNAIMMIAAGNALVCNAHPGGAKCLAEAAHRWNQAIDRAIGIKHLICVIDGPTLESAEAIFNHPQINLLCVTGGPGLAKAALSSPKRAIVAGPGNPPVVVDETADISAAAGGIISGAAYDNNLLCIGEKEVFVVETVAEKLLAEMGRQGGYRLSSEQLDRLAAACIDKHPETGHYIPRKQFIGQDALVIAKAIGLDVPAATRLLFGATRETNPFVACEQMMPVLPIVSVRDVDEGIAKAVYYEHGFRHTAIMWSRNIENLTRMGKACNATIYVKNGSCVAGLGVGGEGYTSFSTASPTGEGVTSPLTFTRYRRCVMVDQLRVV